MPRCPARRAVLIRDISAHGVKCSRVPVTSHLAGGRGVLGPYCGKKRISARNCLAYLTSRATAGLRVLQPDNSAKLNWMTVNLNEGCGSA